MNQMVAFAVWMIVSNVALAICGFAIRPFDKERVILWYQLMHIFVGICIFLFWRKK